MLYHPETNIIQAQNEYTKYLQDLIVKNNAQTYIRFKGHADMTLQFFRQFPFLSLCRYHHRFYHT